MTKEKAKEPQLRFKGFTNAWEQRDIGKLVDVYDGTHQTPKYTDSGVMFLSVEDIKTLQSEKYISEEAFENEFKIRPERGDVLMTRIGDIGTVNVVDSDEAIAYYVSLALLKQKELEPYFLKASIQSVTVQNEIWKRTLHIAFPKKINKNEIAKVPMHYPSKDEQGQIGFFFKEIDQIITLHQRKCDLLFKTKKTLLQKMFPKNGETTPEIRFKGFTGAWEQRKLGELAEYKKGPFGSALKKDMFVDKSEDSIKVYEQQNAINKDWKLERYFIPKTYATTKLKNFDVHSGDIIVSCAGTIGEIYEIPAGAESGVINQALMRVRINNDYIDKRMFIIIFSNMIDEFSNSRSNGSAIKNIPPFADLKSTQVLLPRMEEQRKLSSYFEQLDHLITLHQHELEKLKNIKKSCLKMMFV